MKSLWILFNSVNFREISWNFVKFREISWNFMKFRVRVKNCSKPMILLYSWHILAQANSFAAKAQLGKTTKSGLDVENSQGSGQCMSVSATRLGTRFLWDKKSYPWNQYCWFHTLRLVQIIPKKQLGNLFLSHLVWRLSLNWGCGLCHCHRCGQQSPRIGGLHPKPPLVCALSSDDQRSTYAIICAYMVIVWSN